MGGATPVFTGESRPVPRIARLVVVVLGLLVFFGLPSAVALYTDWLWYGETGYRAVFATTLGTRLLLGVVAFVITAAWLRECVWRL